MCDDDCSDDDFGVSDGRVSTLPGHMTAALSGTTCDKCGQVAVVRIQGETDSFGCEYHHYCDSCKTEFLKEVQENPVIDTCEWCLKENVKLRPIRDSDEGMSGPVYEVCDECRQRENDRINDQLAEMDDD